MYLRCRCRSTLALWGWCWSNLALRWWFARSWLDGSLLRCVCRLLNEIKDRSRQFICTSVSLIYFQGHFGYELVARQANARCCRGSCTESIAIDYLMLSTYDQSRQGDSAIDLAWSLVAWMSASKGEVDVVVPTSRWDEYGLADAEEWDGCSRADVD